MTTPTQQPLYTELGIRVLSVPREEDLVREISRVGVAEKDARGMAAKGQALAIRLDGVPAPAAHMLQQEMRAAGGDAVSTGNGPVTTVILLGTLAQLRQLSARLDAGELPSIAAAIRRVMAQYAAPRGALCCGRHVLPLGEKTYLMGILNLTPDSFSGDGLAGNVEQALRRAEQMLEDGADLLDVGGESTRPGAEAVPLAEELRRVLPIVRALARFDVPISVDTYKSAVAAEAVQAGATLINDISGLRFDAGMAAVIAAAQVPVVVMHIQGAPRTMQQRPEYDDLMTEVCDYLRESTALAVAAGIPRSQVVLDPGFGFGKTVGHNLEVIRRLRELTSYGQPVLLGTSRKSTIGSLLGGLPPEERVEGTAATVALGIANGADIVRVHDVQAMARVARMTDAIVREVAGE